MLERSAARLLLAVCACALATSRAPAERAGREPQAEQAARAQAPAAQPARPNIVLVVADDLGAKELGCYGGSVPTPRLDRLAAEGMRFETCFATPLCQPSRVLALTGKYGFRTGYLGNDKHYKPRPGSPAADLDAYTTFADVCRSAGYATGLVGKWHLPGQLPGLVYDAGFDEYLIWGARAHLPPEVAKHWYGDLALTPRYWNPALLENGQFVPTRPGDYGPDLYTDWAIDFMRRHRHERFLLYYPMCLLHRPHEETPDPEHPGRRLRSGIDSYLRYTDHLVGRLADALAELELADDTILIFTGDNGTQDEGKSQPTELGARVPYIAVWPGRIAPGAASRELTDLADVLPTLAELAGGELPADWVGDGRSLVPTLLDARAAHREWIFSYVDEERIVRTRRWLFESAFGLYDCGESRDGAGYRFVASDLEDPAAAEAQKELAPILARLPAPEVRFERPARERDAWRAWHQAGSGADDE